MAKQHKTKWVVVYRSGASISFTCEEDARAECLMSGGFKIIPPLYR